MTHFGAPMGSQAKVAKFRPFLRQILTFLTPHPANQVNFSLSKMAFRGVSHTVLQVLCSTGTSGGYYEPSEIRFEGILALYLYKRNRPKGPKIPLNLTSEGLKYPPEVRVEHKTCSTICGTPVQAILGHRNWTKLAE